MELGRSPTASTSPAKNHETAARREFAEETGFAPTGNLISLGVFRQPSGKLTAAWAAEGELDAAALRSNLSSMEWPPHSVGALHRHT